MFRRIINRLLRMFGYEVVRTTSGSGFVPERVKLMGSPKTVIDVGVARGTKPLYDAFPDAHIILVEPVTDFHTAELNQIKKQYPNVTLVETAAGESKGTTEINVELGGSSRSSILNSTALDKLATASEKRVINVQRLDDLAKEHQWEGPFGIKVDTEGYELHVVKGCTDILDQVEFFILEVSVAERFEGCYTFEELIAYMDSIGFAVTDVLDFCRPGLVGTLHTDLVFQKAVKRTR